jgi:hypothetical protein
MQGKLRKRMKEWYQMGSMADRKTDADIGVVVSEE